MIGEEDLGRRVEGSDSVCGRWKLWKVEYSVATDGLCSKACDDMLLYRDARMRALRGIQRG